MFQSGLDTIGYPYNNYSILLLVQLKNGVPVEVDGHMPELAENAPVQVPVLKNKRRRRILIFCVVSLINVGLLALLLTQLLTPAPNSASDPLIGHAAPNFSL